MTTKIVDKGAARLRALMAELKTGSVEVGGLDEETARKLAFAEFGTKTAPARPVIRQTIAARQRQLGATMAAELDAMIALGVPARVGLERIGATVAAELRAAIYAFQDPPNAPATVLRKLKNDPLVDTGAMAEKIGWRVVVKRAGR